MEIFSWQDKNEDGEKLIYQATHFGGWWQLESAPKLGRSQRDEVEFNPDEFTPDIWVTLRDLLWRKYQRRRVSWALVEHVDEIIAGRATNERRDRRPDETPQGRARPCRPDRPGRRDRRPRRA